MQLIIKRIVDILSALFLSLLLSPILLLILLLLLAEGGHVLFIHPRIGKGGKIFKCLKFRTMVIHADQALETYLAHNFQARKEWEERHKLRYDPRVTPLGKFLRKTSLDELPQLWNVLKGEMSLIGPRPIIAEEMPKYRASIRHYLAMKPGLTGLWQVSGRSNTSYPQRVFLDSWYVTHWSLCLDFVILLKTLPTVLFMRGSH